MSEEVGILIKDIEKQLEGLMYHIANIKHKLEEIRGFQNSSKSLDLECAINKKEEEENCGCS